ncbi:SO2930 family diheme c-type cytochrome [Pararhodonellum marinum]|uniref:SO2930 family diheme c-type cytochrome n=1 Tax=Pararhodonellum marinum TaxID=2755358 RepID=UPI00188F99E4|nr:SO2930 family diheme c-type cytochrome [Pararhodonellum marinum]
MRHLFASCLIFLFMGCAFLHSCQQPANEKSLAQLDFKQLPLKKLSEYGFFAGELSDLLPNNRVLFYEPASSLFTDYAFKSRFIYLAEGKSVKILDNAEGEIDFPDETILIKNFYYPLDFRVPEGKKQIIETRLMIKMNGSWEAYPYIWDEDQKDATYKITGGEKEVKWMDLEGEDQLIEYIIPNKNQCKSCHNQNNEMVPIGVKAKHLNHEISYGDRSNHQLVEWNEKGFVSQLQDLENLPKMINYQDKDQALHDRAMAYLDINCAHCHREDGPASTSGLFLNYEEKDWRKLGVFKTPVAAGFGAGSFKYAIFPGKADESIMTHRMASTEIGAAMPEIGRVMVHDEGLELIKNWISSLSESEMRAHFSSDFEP